MAAVNLDRAWLSDAADLTDSLSFVTAAGGDEESVGGGVRSYANGRVRLVSTKSGTQTVARTAVNVTWADVQWFRAHEGRLMLLRDKPGRKVYGAFFNVNVQDRRAQLRHDVTFTFQRVSHAEAV